jgi:hypothetical protein
MTTIDPSKPYHTRSPIHEVRNVHEFYGVLWGEGKLILGVAWKNLKWELDGTSTHQEIYDIIQEPEVKEKDEVSVSVKGLLAIRDALIVNDKQEAYHQLYNLVKWNDPYKPWSEWETIQGDKVKIEGGN